MACYRWVGLIGLTCLVPAPLRAAPPDPWTGQPLAGPYRTLQAFCREVPGRSIMEHGEAAPGFRCDPEPEKCLGREGTGAAAEALGHIHRGAGAPQRRAGAEVRQAAREAG